MATTTPRVRIQKDVHGEIMDVDADLHNVTLLAIHNRAPQDTQDALRAATLALREARKLALRDFLAEFDPR
jgi:hypothetical protein